MTTLRSGLRACSVKLLGARPILRFDQRGVEAHAVRGRDRRRRLRPSGAPWPRRAGCRCRFPSAPSARPDGSIRVRLRETSSTGAKRRRGCGAAAAGAARARRRVGVGAARPRSAVHSTWRGPAIRIRASGALVDEPSCSRRVREDAMRENGIATCQFARRVAKRVIWSAAAAAPRPPRSRFRAPCRRKSARSARSGTARPPRC